VTTNRFERVDEPQPDAISLMLWTSGGRSYGRITCPAAVSAGRLPYDVTSEELGAIEAFRSAIKLANELRAPVVVIDRDGVWKPEWGELYRDSEL
jgi:hypothetical protein